MANLETQQIDLNNQALQNNSDCVLGLTKMDEELMKPLNLDNSMLLVCNSGWAIMLLYNKKFLFKKGDLLIANWDMHPVILKTSNSFSTFYCTLSDQFFYEVFRNVSSNFCHFTYNFPILKLDKDKSHQLKIWIEQFVWIDNNMNGIQKKQMLINYVQSLMFVIDEEIQKLSKTIPIKALPRQLEILRAFGDLLQKNIPKHHDVAFYAERLSITPYYLSNITSKTIKESPKTLIDKQLIQEIKKRILLKLPIKVIVEDLYFEDQSYMNKFFKRYTGSTLSDYRNKNS